MPHSLARKLMANNKLPTFTRLMEYGDMKEMLSVVPPISSIAWSSFMTGKNPANHNILGFIDRMPESTEIYFPNSEHMKSKTLWEILSDHGKKVAVINVPVTYPPREVNGLLVGGFLSPNLESAVYPKNMTAFFEQNNYVIDADADLAATDPDKFLDELFRILHIRFDILFKLLDRQEWDFFLYHIMETDRLYHFYFARDEKDYASRFTKFHQIIDKYIEKLLEKLPDDVFFMMLSDHGFCPLDKEINLNYLLWDNGFLKFDNDPPMGYTNMSRSTKAFSLIPGRIFVNLEGREFNGSVKAGEEYNNVISDLVSLFEGFADPETGKKVIEYIYMRDDVYKGDNLHRAADMFVLPYNGYDLKAAFNTNTFFEETHFFGMHTYDDAFLYINEGKIQKDNFSIIDLAPSILNVFGIDDSEKFDGEVIF